MAAENFTEDQLAEAYGDGAEAAAEARAEGATVAEAIRPATQPRPPAWASTWTTSAPLIRQVTR